MTSWTEIMTSQPQFQNRVAIFADIIKTVTVFIKTVFRDSRKVKRIINYVLKWNLLSVFLDIAKFKDFR